jgi:hypothetical protein
VCGAFWLCQGKPVALRVLVQIEQSGMILSEGIVLCLAEEVAEVHWVRPGLPEQQWQWPLQPVAVQGHWLLRKLLFT